MIGVETCPHTLVDGHTSRENSFPLSRTAAQVNPAVDDPVPVVRTERGESAAAKRRN